MHFFFLTHRGGSLSMKAFTVCNCCLMHFFYVTVEVYLRGCLRPLPYYSGPKSRWELTPGEWVKFTIQSRVEV